MYESTYQHEGDLDAFNCDLTHDLADFDRLVAYHRAMSQAEQSFARILACMAALESGQRDDAEENKTPLAGHASTFELYVLEETPPVRV